METFLYALVNESCDVTYDAVDELPDDEMVYFIVTPKELWLEEHVWDDSERFDEFAEEFELTGLSESVYEPLVSVERSLALLREHEALEQANDLIEFG